MLSYDHRPQIQDSRPKGSTMPDQERRSPGLAVTKTDVQLFRWLWMVRVMTLAQLRRVGYYQPDTGRLSSLDNVRKRLRRLYRKGYLLEDTVQQTQERLYLLGERALPELHEHCGIAQRRLYKPKSLDTGRQVHHALLVSECAVRMAEAVRGSTVEIPDLPPLGVSFYHTHAVENPQKRKHVDRFVTQEDVDLPGRFSKRPGRIRPDLVFALAVGAVQRLYFLEADRGSESVQQIAEKQIGYHHYHQTYDSRHPDRYLWQRYGPASDLRVLLVTTNTHRVEQLRRQLRNEDGSRLLVLTTAEQLKNHNPVFDPIWTDCDGARKSLIRPDYDQLAERETNVRPK